MRKIFIVLVMACMAMAAVAAPVSKSTAAKYAKHFLQRSEEPTLAYENGSYYVFTFNPGFVIISADDKAKPVLGFSEEGKFDAENIPTSLLWYMQSYSDEIQMMAKDNNFKPMNWNKVLKTTAEDEDIIVAPLVQTQWGQGHYYNFKCPSDPSGDDGHALVGCVALAMGQLMRYWSFPHKGQDSYCYYENDYGKLCADFEETYYDYENMPLQLDASSSHGQINATALLLAHCGISVDMDYGTDGSGTQTDLVAKALRIYFKYPSNVGSYDRDNVSDSAWIAKMKSELDDAAPLVYKGHDKDGNNGHAFICDGYRADDFFHFNWGWNGYADGWFSVDHLGAGGSNYNYGQQFIVNVRKPQGVDDPIRGAVDETEGVKVEVMPNPVVDVLNIYSESEPMMVTVISSTGQEVISTTETEINVSGLADGVYFVKVVTEDGVVTKTVLKK